MFKGQDSCMCIKAVSSRAEVAVDGPGALTGEGIGEVEWLMGSAGMDDVVGSSLRQVKQRG